MATVADRRATFVRFSTPLALPAWTLIKVPLLTATIARSRNTTEPHFHVDAVDPEKNDGVSMSFNGRVSARNTLYVD